MNAQNNGKAGAFSQVKETAFLGRSLVRAALKGALATVHKGSGHPYASLVLVATDTDGSPLVLISKLALHTQNLAADPRASLLIDATGTEANPMEGARLTLVGEVHPATSTTARARFLARHPAAVGYADFPDFGFFALRPERAHYIGGFGKIVDLPEEDLLVSTEGAEGLITAEPDIVSHMNADHADAIKLYATKLLGAACSTHVSDMTGAWRMSGIDPEGCDLVLGARALRLPFGSRIATAAEARAELVRLVGVARAG